MAAATARPRAGFWSGKRVLLTGHTGFKGSWAALWLARLGAHVTGLALAPHQAPALFDLAGVARECESLIVDLRDLGATRAALTGREVDLVLHMAAQPIVRASIEDPVGTFASNVMGTVHLLEVLRAQRGLTAVLTVTSDKVYANREQGRPFVETDPLGGKDPYSASKAASELVVESYASSFFERGGVAIATARGGNVIGGGDFSRDRLVPDIVRATRRDEATVLRDPEATRPWQHVLDCLAGYLLYLEQIATEPGAHRALNFGPCPGGGEVTVGELATRAVGALGGKPWRHVTDPASIEARALRLDASKAKLALGFESRLDAPRAVDWTMDWYRRQALGEDAAALCHSQIETYERL